MAVNLKAPVRLAPIAGIELSVAQAGIKKAGRDDIAVLKLAEGSAVAAVFTRNAFAAAPVQIARENLAQSPIRALLINSGNANAGTGEPGLEDAKTCCSWLAQAMGLAPGNVLPFSTGVIGARLPLAKMQAAISGVVAGFREDAWHAAASAIMTTDTVAKGASRTIELAGGQTVTITGVSKGSGMIRPDMATMLAFVGTDAQIAQADLQSLLAPAVDASFNSITVDGDTSTNDACVLCASGQGPALQPGTDDWQAFVDALQDIFISLAQAIVRDGEGATKFITVDVDGARSVAEARQVAFTVAHSPLVKTACFASDPNWGRILAAVGRAGVADMEINKVGLKLDHVAILAHGEPMADYSEADAAAVMAQAEFSINIDLGRGSARARIWTSDLSYDYVKINAEYRS